MINLDQIDNIPIIVVSTPRSGSTFLADYISTIKGYKFFNEPAKSNQQLNDFLTYDLRNKDYVLKEHSSKLMDMYSENFLVQPSYKIRIRRKNVFNQILSNYIAASRKKFIFFKGIHFNSDIIEFNEELLYTVARRLKLNISMSTNFKYKIDLDLYYEDLEFPEYKIIPTIKPLNNDELTDWAYNILKDKL